MLLYMYVKDAFFKKLVSVLQSLFNHRPALIVHGYQYICSKLMLVDELIKYCKINAGTMHE